MSGNHNTTTNHNKEFLLKELKLSQYRNSTIFENKDYFVLSPSIQNKNNWFDLRQINLEKLTKEKKGKLLIRLYDDFILIDLRKFMTDLLDNDPYDSTNSGIHWKFQIKEVEGNKMYIFNTKTKQKFFVEKTDKNGVLNKI
ncbi:MAG: hypothetical protein APF83_02900 [Lutibacter sp. BRH_c52]|nr:MAG: hypothetical protein APF83_02900 [Lutibacter sp. BRH_c52]